MKPETETTPTDIQATATNVRRQIMELWDVTSARLSSADEIIAAALLAERERCANIARKYPKANRQDLFEDIEKDILAGAERKAHAVPDELTALRNQYHKLTAGKYKSAEIVDKDGTFDCPMCDGEGSVEGEQYINFDDKPLNVLFTGIGDEFMGWQKLFDDFVAMLAAPSPTQAVPEYGCVCMPSKVFEEILEEYESEASSVIDNSNCSGATARRYQRERDEKIQGWRNAITQAVPEGKTQSAVRDDALPLTRQQIETLRKSFKGITKQTSIVDDLCNMALMAQPPSSAEPHSTDWDVVKDAIVEWVNAPEAGFEEILKTFDRLRASHAEQAALLAETLKAAHKLQEHCGQSLEDTLNGKWTYPPAAQQARRVERLMDIIRECVYDGHFLQTERGRIALGTLADTARENGK